MQNNRDGLEAKLAELDAKLSTLAVTPLEGAKLPNGVKKLAKKGQTSGRLEEPDVETLRSLLQQRADLFEEMSKNPFPETTLKGREGNGPSLRLAGFKPEFRLKK